MSQFRKLTAITDTSETTICAAQSGKKLCALKITVANSHATQGVLCSIRDATGGTVIDTIYCPAKETRGWSLSRPMKQDTVNSNWTLQADASATLSVSWFGVVDG